MSKKSFPSGFDSACPLPGDGEGLLRQVFYAQRNYGIQPNVVAYFQRTGLNKLLDHCDAETCDWKARECRYWMLMAAVMREDIMAARKLLNYWWEWRGGQPQPKSAIVRKFNPGEHYHVLGEKFPSLDAARQFLSRRGYDFSGFVEEHYLYPREGD